jgi:hypothetical protein
MAGDFTTDPAKALEYKEKGNRCFQAGDYSGAEAMYTKACVSPFLLYSVNLLRSPTFTLSQPKPNITSKA